MWVALALVAGVGLFAWVVWSKGQPFAQGDVFRASRWSRGNHLFPTQVQITRTAVVQYTPRLIGRREESIHLAHVSSVRIDTHAVFADVFIETSGGSDPVSCHGHTKRDASAMKGLIERYQTDYYRQGNTAGAVPPVRS